MGGLEKWGTIGRCTFIRPTGQRCRQQKIAEPSVDENPDLCPLHNQYVRERVSLWRRANDVADISIEQHLTYELRMSWTMVRMSELAVMDLGVEYEAFVRKVRVTEVKQGGGPNGDFTSVTTSAELSTHPLITQYLLERKHHMDVVRLCVNAGLAARQIAAVERVVEQMMLMASALAEELGHDAHDPAVRRAIVAVLKRTEDALQDSLPSDTRALEG